MILKTTERNRQIKVRITAVAQSQRCLMRS